MHTDRGDFRAGGSDRLSRGWLRAWLCWPECGLALDQACRRPSSSCAKRSGRLPRGTAACRIS